MPTCQNCNANLPENAAFCAKCGHQVIQPVQQFVSQQHAPQQNSTVKKIHCPNCKSGNIQISTESSVNGAVTANHGGFSTTSVSNTHRNFWFCSDCGTKFRNIQNLEEEIQKSKNTHIILFIFAAIAFCLFLYFATSISDGPFAGMIFIPFTIGCAIGTALFIGFAFSSMSKVKKMRSELEYLKEACYN